MQIHSASAKLQPSQLPPVISGEGSKKSATAPFPSENGGVGEQTLPTPPQCSTGQHLDQTTQQCVPNTPIPPQTDTSFHFTAAGDFRDNTNTDENMAANNPEIVLILGDFSYNGNAAQWWSKNMDALNNLNIIGAIGNHDDPNKDFLNLWPLNKGKWEFIYKVGNVAFVAFDTENNDPSTIDPLLAQAQADSTVEHIIPFAHKTLFTPTPGNPLKPDANKGYFDVFKKYDKIRMILGGHNHFYARMNAVSGTDFVYVTVGNGGANPHQDSGETGSPPQQYVKSNGALHCDVNNETISCKMISNEGKVWDEFTITPGNPPKSQQDPAQGPIITQHIPLIEKQSQPGYLILTTNIINDNGGTRLASDFTINIVGNTSTPSFQAIQTPEIKTVSINEGEYSVYVNNFQGYSVSQQNQCESEIKSGEVKTCLITIDDVDTTIPLSSSSKLP
ncbi:MAG TPA: metallophosphoesterase [Nitrososphaeraceae archaeon]|nr:metallophosphoesterase [Nitrososphaeraceae archaeon]